ncbi:MULTISPECIES: hypothetical protein [unclassified Duganella]|uniref:hypothetical protein n=1 Tax=unclassified Duganella TaxID=2636909 RepID=UPI000E34A7B9|nr:MULTISPECIES: hypothetical protein [unclassified Duganella]RFP09225.1 hypothetical protein D0T23_26275 [Duganella sp. BJB475]RFP25451.1 hypothetical protein D0T21_28360 [Duganella sp. BJB476]
MFEVTADDIHRLSDSDLRSLVGRLCVAEVRKRQQSSLAVTYGGHQDAPDGGIDVRIDLPPDAPQLTGFVGHCIGFQVKKPAMGPAEISKEMRPDDALRPVIAALAKAGGSYIIVSSGDSVSATALNTRRAAMRAALVDCADGAGLTVDFYDRQRLATWVGEHPGEVLWVRTRCGRQLRGWSGYEDWSYPVLAGTAGYLPDDGARIRIGRGAQPMGTGAALQAMRNKLSTPGTALRLIGLSGVGKTSLVQALFDERVGDGSLPQALAVYTNMGCDQDPPPPSMASDLIALQKRAVLVVDNCMPEMHRELVRLCRREGSLLSLITVEYDVRGDQPEGTEVVEMAAGSRWQIEALLKVRHPHLGAGNRDVIADHAGGNARIALALATTVRDGDSLAGLSDADLFHRLFWQRHAVAPELLAAARACALVYSFDGDTLDGVAAELPMLAQLAGMDALRLAGHVSELHARDLMQSRGQWRALLPHALANRLAEEALRAIPFQHLRNVLEHSAPPRLLRSFCRRLSYFPDHRVTLDLAAEWLVAGGRLGQPASYDDEQRMMFHYLAPSARGLALALLERCAVVDLIHYHDVLLELVYDAALFERTLALMLRIRLEHADAHATRAAEQSIVGLFAIHGPGTMAPWELRLGIVERWLSEPSAALQQLALDALEYAVRRVVMGPPSWQRAMDCDDGLAPADNIQSLAWLGQSIALLAKEATGRTRHAAAAKAKLAQSLPALIFDAASRPAAFAALRTVAAAGFWLHGWRSLRMARARMPIEWSEAERVVMDALEVILSPSDLAGEALAALSAVAETPGESYEDGLLRLDAALLAIGQRVAVEDGARDALLPELMCSGGRCEQLGRAFAMAIDPAVIWQEMVAASRSLPMAELTPNLMRGFLVELGRLDPQLTERLLEAVLDDPQLVVMFPALQGALGYGRAALERLHRCQSTRPGPVADFAVIGNALRGLLDDGSGLLKLLREVVLCDGGLQAGLHIVAQWRLSGGQPSAERQTLILTAAEIVMQRVDFSQCDDSLDQLEANVAALCLAGPDGERIGTELAQRLRLAVSGNRSFAVFHRQLLETQLELQPRATLDAMIGPAGALPGAEGVFFHLPDEPGAVRKLGRDWMLAWCREDPAPRSRFALQVFPLLESDPVSRRTVVAPVATALFREGADPVDLLASVAQRFWPSFYAGSHAAQIEAHVEAMGQLLAMHDDVFRGAVRKLQSDMLDAAAEERKSESRAAREHGGRFE